MNEKVDNGEILEVRRFSINRSDNLSNLLNKTHKELFSLCISFLNSISKEGKDFLTKKIEESKEIKWNGKARRLQELEDLQTVDVKVGKKELEKIIRATYIKEFPPRIVLHGFTFLLKKDD
mgnify:FL=1